ncbi:unnamed protein product [Dicrocoelium dendriticum]|nr:unnamed protein product [Dicrocoelium dendriticum]
MTRVMNGEAGAERDRGGGGGGGKRRIERRDRMGDWECGVGGGGSLQHVTAIYGSSGGGGVGTGDGWIYVGRGGGGGGGGVGREGTSRHYRNVRLVKIEIRRGGGGGGWWGGVGGGGVWGVIGEWENILDTH